MKTFKKIIVWIPALLIAAAIFGFSQQSGDESMGISNKIAGILVDIANSIYLIDSKWNDRAHAIEMMQTPLRKTAHMLEFALLSFAVYYALKYDRLPYRFTKYVTILIVLAVSVSDEFHQLWIMGRSGNPTDVLIDMCGCLIAVFIAAMTDKRKNIII
jgi:VanZ family protein